MDEIKKEEVAAEVKLPKKYLLTMRYPFEAMDDVAARVRAKLIGGAAMVTCGNIELKLQEIFTDKSPRGIAL